MLVFAAAIRKYLSAESEPGSAKNCEEEYVSHAVNTSGWPGVTRSGMG